MSEDAKPERYLDRYEVIAIAIPGGAFLLFLWYLHPELLGTQKLELKDVSLGGSRVLRVCSTYRWPVRAGNCKCRGDGA